MITKDEAKRIYNNLKRRKKKDEIDEKVLSVLTDTIMPSLRKYDCMMIISNNILDFLTKDGIKRLKEYGFRFFKYSKYSECVWNDDSFLISMCRGLNIFNMGSYIGEI